MHVFPLIIQKSSRLKAIPIIQVPAIACNNYVEMFFNVSKKRNDNKIS